MNLNDFPPRGSVSYQTIDVKLCEYLDISIGLPCVFRGNHFSRATLVQLGAVSPIYKNQHGSKVFMWMGYVVGGSDNPPIAGIPLCLEVQRLEDNRSYTHKFKTPPGSGGLNATMLFDTKGKLVSQIAFCRQAMFHLIFLNRKRNDWGWFDPFPTFALQLHWTPEIDHMPRP